MAAWKILIAALLLLPAEALRAQCESSENQFLELSRIPQLKISYYHLSGRNFEELKKSLQEKAPLDLQGKRREAFTYWRLYWNWPFRKNGRAQFERTKVRQELVLTMPCWENYSNASSEMLARWSSYLKALEQHELGHVREALRTTSKLQRSLRSRASSSPKMNQRTAQAMAEAHLKQNRTFDVTYDKQSQQGRLQGVIFPQD